MRGVSELRSGDRVVGHALMEDTDDPHVRKAVIVWSDPEATSPTSEKEG